MKPCKRSEYGYLGPNGYYSFNKLIDNQRSVHRWVYEVTHGVKLTSDQLVLHSCNNSWCIEPTHLRVGTHRDNAIDRIEAGNNSLVKLSKEDIQEIRKLYKTKRYTHTLLADQFKVSISTITRIINRKTWRHVK